MGGDFFHLPAGSYFVISFIDMMDISPLPHKAPCFVAHVTLPSPSPETTPEEDALMISPDEITPVQEQFPLRNVAMDIPLHAPIPE